LELKLEKTSQVEAGDLQVALSGAFIIKNMPFGTLLALREALRKMFGENLLHPTFVSQNVYIVHWNDLSEEYKSRLTRKKNGG
jgi:hypothetical protein